ncbi:MAG: BamA/TamA family outer membrane protein [Ignavibacteriaceae bacterium]
MIHLTKFKLLFFLLITTISSAQRLSSFEITGNFNFDDSQYLRWSGLHIDQPYFIGIVDSAKSNIAKNILLQGYYFFEFGNSHLEFSKDSTTFKISLNIKENSPVVVKNIFFQGVDSTLNDELNYRFRFLKDQIFSKNELENNIDQTLTNFENSGHPFAKIIISSINVYRDTIEDKNYADIYLTIESGIENKIDKVEIIGNASTKDYVIVRELRLNLGETYSQSMIENFPKQLNRLSFFEPVKVPEYYFNSKNEGVLQIVVKEKNTNNFDGIIGYTPPGTNEKTGYVTGLVNISLRNLFGTGRAAAIRWNKYNKDSQELELKYLEPWLLSYPINLNLNLYQKIQDSTYVQRKFEASLEYLATESISASVSVATESVIPTERTIPVFTVYNSSYLTTGLILKIDTRDDPYSPTEGILFTNSYIYSRKSINGPLEYITQDLRTKIDLQKIAVSFYTYYQIFDKQVIAIGVNGKELRGPTFENSDLYKLGGANTLRGYREEQFLGSRILWSNLEYRFLFTKRTFGFLFFDTGYYLRPEESQRDISKAEDFLYGFGLGLNLETSIGVLGVSYALGKGDTFSDGKIHFGILNEF